MSIQDERVWSPARQAILRPSVRRGFTLVEMLAVIAVITALLLVTRPALTSLNRSNTFSADVSQVNTLLEEAHTAALANNTYVWVGFMQLPSNGGVGMAFVYTPSGNPADIFPANGTQAPLRSLNKSIVLSSLHLTKINSTQISDPDRTTVSVGQLSDDSNLLQISNSDSSAVPAQFTASIQGTPRTFTSGATQPICAILEITPSGRLLLSPIRYACIEVGLAPLYGSGNNVAVLQLNTSTGRVTEFRP